tara:strand:+ start:39102 stop:39830 length:729 start_codon:yes stop_codon:yes gene_type:complete
MITICVTTYNRVESTIESFINALDHDLVSEVIILDDASEEYNFKNLKYAIDELNNDKIYFSRNEKNLGAFLNKIECVKKASNDWVVLLDSDNIIDRSYIDNIPDDKKESCFYLPVIASCASSNLNYSIYSGKTFYKYDFKRLLNSSNAKDQCLVNTGNYFFNKNTYLSAIEKENNLQNPHGVCSVYPLFLAFKNLKNFEIYIVPNLIYSHGLTHDSWYMTTQTQSQIFFKTLKQEALLWDTE